LNIKQSFIFGISQNSKTIVYQEDARFAAKSKSLGKGENKQLVSVVQVLLVITFKDMTQQVPALQLIEVRREWQTVPKAVEEWPVDLVREN
jgi:hypothetical protein